MTPLEFLTVVLPSTGYYCIVELTTPKKQHVYVESIQEAVKTAEQFNSLNYDTYFAVSSFAQPTNRKVENAKSCKSLFVDIDCGPTKNYVSQLQAIEALNEFVGIVGLPSPTVVSSGYGIHAYWAFSHELPVKECSRIASRFKDLALLIDVRPKQSIQPDVSLPNRNTELGDNGLHSSGGNNYINGTSADVNEELRVSESVSGVSNGVYATKLAIDAGVTGDFSRILRVPGTINWKNRNSPRNVEILSVGEKVEPAVLDEVFKKHLPEKQSEVNGVNGFFDVLGPGPVTGPASAVQILTQTNSTTKFRDLIAAIGTEKECAQVAFYIENATMDGLEPLWRGVLSLAKYCVDAETATARVSALHPYSEERTATKLREIKGPYPCHKFNSDNPGICPKCPHLGKITNPLALIRNTNTSPTEKTLVEVPAAPPLKLNNPVNATPIVQLERPKAPKGFEYGSSGGVYSISTTKDDAGKPQVQKSLVIPFDFFALDLLLSDRKHLVHFVAYKNGKFENVIIPQRSIVSRDEALKLLSEQNIVAVNSQDVALHKYVRACVEHVSHNKAPIEVPPSCGWQTDDSFVFDNRVFSPDGSERRFPMPALDNIFKSSTPKGTLDTWRGIIRMLVRNEEYEVLAMSLVGFGAPLMRFTGLYGMTFHLGSTESGTGKTLAIELAASVWGDPVKSRTTIDTSSVATLNRLGLLGSLPLCTDEITAKNRNDFEWLPAFLFAVTEGHGKERMESGANKERINTTYWQSLVLLSSNTHVMDYLTGARKHSSEGEVRRMLELTLNKQMRLSSEDVDEIKKLSKNYAVAGERYVRWLVQNQSTANDVVRQIYDSLYKDFKATNDERFWMAGVSAIVAGGVLAGSGYADVMDYPMKNIVEVLRRMVQRSRLAVRDSARTAEDILNAFIRQNYGKLVIVRKVIGTGITAQLGGGRDIDESITRSEVIGRVEHLRVGSVDIIVEEAIMKTFCASMSYGYADFKQNILRSCSVFYTKRDLLAGTKGPPLPSRAIVITRRAEDMDDSAMALD